MCGDDARERPSISASVGGSVDAPWLAAAVSAVRPGGSVAGVDPIGAGGRRSTVVVRFSDAEPIVVRGGPDGDGGSIATERALLAAVADRTTVPVPEPLGWGAIGGNAETGVDGGVEAWLATRFVDGDDLHERFGDLGPTARRGVAAAFGRYLGELHEAFRFDGYGRLGADGETLRTRGGSNGGNGVDASAWRRWLVERGRESLDRLPAAFGDVADAARGRLDAWTVETAPTPRLYPWDLRPGNALVAEAEVAAIVDWESPLAAGGALSVAKAEYLLADWYVPDEADALRRAFRAGYAEVRPVPAVDDSHRIVAVAETAVDSHGRVTNPRYPPVDRSEAVRFHRKHLGDAAGVEE